MKLHTVTFVTALIDLEEDRSKDRSIETRIKLFKHIASTGIAICLYVSSNYEIIAKELEKEFNNVKFMNIINFKDLETYKIITNLNPQLPIIRTIYHDTLNFMILMNAKSEFVYKASLINPFNTEHFSWIDFSICHMVNNIEYIKTKLKLFGYSKLKKTMIIFPCCFNFEKSKEKINNISMQIIWRFCGSFFIGDKLSIQNMHNLMITELPNFIKHTGTNIIAWEINVWAWLEIYCNWKIDYYIADHNNTILDIPNIYISVVASLTSIPSRFSNCNLVINSLINQVDYIYLNLCKEYSRFKELKINNNTDNTDNTDTDNTDTDNTDTDNTDTDNNTNLPEYFLTEEPYKSKLIITYGQDYGPATKYLGALEYISNSQWIFFCDDDQEYHHNLISKMINNISDISIYQNRYNIINNGSGGIIHGYVGNLIHRSLLNELPKFDLPDSAKYVDDQWMSIYCHLNNIKMYPSGIENYNDIFSVLENGYEKIGKDALAQLNNRDIKIKELEKYYNIKFINDGNIINDCNIINNDNDNDNTLIYKTTIVTFYFNIKILKDSTDGVRTQSFYLDKGRETLKLPYPMVIFCDEDNYIKIKQIRDEYIYNQELTKYIIKNITEYDFYKENFDIINENRKNNEFYKTSRVTSSYCLVTCFKIIAIYLAKQNNFFNSEYFAWIDFGGSHVMKDFNNSAKKMLDNPNSKISFCYIHYRNNELYPMNIFLKNGGYCTVGGTSFTVHKDYVNKFYNGCISIFHEILFNGVGHCDEQVLTYFYNKFPELCNIYYGDYYSILENYHEPIKDHYCIINNFIKQAISNNKNDLAQICAKKLITTIKKYNLPINKNDLLYLEKIII
jgi:hypothetical protein